MTILGWLRYTPYWLGLGFLPAASWARVLPAYAVDPRPNENKSAGDHIDDDDAARGSHGLLSAAPSDRQLCADSPMGRPNPGGTAVLFCGLWA